MSRTVVAVAGMIAILCSSTALAQTQRSGNADTRVMQQLQQITAERAALQAENAELKQDLERTRKELQQASAGRSALENRARALEVSAGRGETSAKQTQDELERTRAQLQELIGKFRETAQTLRDIEADRATVKTRLTAQERELKSCIDSNAGLYNLNAEVLDRLDKRGVWSALAGNEPFTKLKRVELENLIDDYRYRADELKRERG